MTLASIVPYQAGAIGLVIAEGDATHLEVIHHESIMVGRLVVIDPPENGKTLRRELSDAELSATCTQLLALIKAHGVAVAHIETPSRRSLLASRIYHAICGKLEDYDVAHETVFSGWRYRFGEPNEYRPKARELVARLFGSEAWCEFDSTLYAGALLCHKLLIDVEPVPARTRNLPGLSRPDAEANKVETPTVVSDTSSESAVIVSSDPQPTPPVSVRGASLESKLRDSLGETPESEATEAHSIELIELGADNEANGTVRAGLDSGSHWIGLVIAVGDKAPLKALVIRTLQGGNWVQLPKPKITIDADGKEHSVDRKWVFTFEDASACADRILDELVRHKVQSLTVEFTDSLHGMSDGGGAEFAGTELIRASWVWVLVHERARLAGIRIRRVRPATWRAKVVGRARSGGDGAELIPGAVRGGFSNWPDPRKTNNHDRDAGGLVLYDVVMDQAEADEKRATEMAQLPEADREKPKRKRPPRKGGSSKKKEKSREARERSGCTCPGKSHRKECPLYKRKAAELSPEALDLNAPLRHEKKPAPKGYRIMINDGYLVSLKLFRGALSTRMSKEAADAMVFDSYQSARGFIGAPEHSYLLAGARVKFPNGTLRS